VLSRQAQSLRFATAAAAVQEITSNDPSDPTKPNWIDLKDKGIKHGVKAFVLEVPKKLPENEFNSRRKAVEEHAHCESGGSYEAFWGMVGRVRDEWFQHEEECSSV